MSSPSGALPSTLASAAGSATRWEHAVEQRLIDMRTADGPASEVDTRSSEMTTTLVVAVPSLLPGGT